jgi:hypothetical protein
MLFADAVSVGVENIGIAGGGLFMVIVAEAVLLVPPGPLQTILYVNVPVSYPRLIEVVPFDGS